jgi:hypothetical protein
MASPRRCALVTRRPAACAALVAAAILIVAAAATAADAATAPRHHRALSSNKECLCIFDVDRTLTTLQGSKTCPGDRIYANVADPAYPPTTGPFTASEFALRVGQSWCGRSCRLAVITAGTMPSGGKPDAEHRVIADLLSKNNGNAKMPGPEKLPWASFSSGQLAPFVHSAPHLAKFKAVPTIQKYYANNAGAKIDDDAVFFFDDIAANVQPWRSTKYHAHQISCLTRARDPQKTSSPSNNKELGLCGATLAEINALAFRKTCSLCTGAC